MKTILTLIAAAPLLAAQTAASSYTIIDLGTLGGAGTNSTAFELNPFGWVAGSSNLVSGGPQHAFLWLAGHMKDLGTLDGAACPTCNSGADGPNLLGQAAVGSETSTDNGPNGEDFCGFGTHHQCRGAIWKGDALTALPNLPGGNNANAFDLNDLGQVVGFAETGAVNAACSQGTPFQVHQFEAVIWDANGQIRMLQPLPASAGGNLFGGDTVGFALGINDFGQAIGASGLCSNTSLPPNNPAGAHAVLWQSDGTPVNLGSLGGDFNVASAINNRGQVVGASESPADGTIHTFLWTPQTGMQDYGAYPNAIITVTPCCRTLNDFGQMVGFAIDGTTFNSTALIWQGKTPTNLNNYIAGDSGWFLEAALSINDIGEIVGYGAINGNQHGFLLIPQ